MFDNEINIDNLGSMNDEEQMALMARLLAQVKSLSAEAASLNAEVSVTRQMISATREEVLDLRDQLADMAIASGAADGIFEKVYA